jgi:uncharacterized protein (TIGR02058 family)
MAGVPKIVVSFDPPWYFALEQSADDKTMTKKRLVLEIGMGTDIRGADPTKAACRALRDALWHNSLSIATALGHPLDAMIIDVHIGVPRPEMVDKAQVLAVLPYGKATVTVIEGGLEVRNDADTDSTLIANACAVVSLDI